MTIRMTEQEYEDYQKRQGRPLSSHVPWVEEMTNGTPRKYRNQPVIVEGIRFDSKKEAARWSQLKMMEKAGAISNLKRQISFELAPSVVIQGRKRPPLKYTCDFHYISEDGFAVIEDTKSEATKDTAYKIRRHLLKAIHGIEITEI